MLRDFIKALLSAAAVTAAALLFVVPASADPLSTAIALHQRLIGAPPSESVAAAMAAKVAAGNTAAAAQIAMADTRFYDYTLKNWVAPWTNEEQAALVPLNDFTAMVIGIIRDERDFRDVLTADLIYVADPMLVGMFDPMSAIPPYNGREDTHFLALDKSRASLRDVLVAREQSALFYGLPSEATAGVITTRAASQAFFTLGTNRTMYRFMQLNFLCEDMDALQDSTLAGDRIRQDVNRNPADEPSSFINRCGACHSGLDSLSGAFARYDFPTSFVVSSSHAPFYANQLLYTADKVFPKYLQNSTVFPEGYKTVDDSWTNPWRNGRNSRLGWDPDLPGKGVGIKSLGQELAYSRAFSECQVKKAFQLVCLTPPQSGDDRLAVQRIADSFENNQYNMKLAFGEVAAYCVQGE